MNLCQSLCIGLLCGCGFIGYESLGEEEAPSNIAQSSNTPETSTATLRTDEAGAPILSDLFFDDFEGTLGGGADSLDSAGGATLSLTTTPTWAGNQALAFNAPATGISRRARITKLYSPFLGEQSERVFLRFYLYVPSGFSIENYVIIAEFDDDQGNENGVNKISLDLKSRNRLSIAVNSGDYFRHTPDNAFTRDTWSCVEMELVMDEARGAVQLWVDDALVIESNTNIDTQPGVGISEFIYGGVFVANGESEAASFYMDELVLARERVGCE